MPSSAPSTALAHPRTAAAMPNSSLTPGSEDGREAEMALAPLRARSGEQDND
jgi:hypothetical protein